MMQPTLWIDLTTDLDHCASCGHKLSTAGAHILAEGRQYVLCAKCTTIYTESGRG